jgi:hypothetical protein
MSSTRATARTELPPHRYTAALAAEIEARWQERWEREGTFHAANPVGALSAGFTRVADRRKYYLNDMFPYPSGAGLHVGHLWGPSRGSLYTMREAMRRALPPVVIRTRAMRASSNTMPKKDRPASPRAG